MEYLREIINNPQCKQYRYFKLDIEYKSMPIESRLDIPFGIRSNSHFDKRMFYIPVASSYRGGAEIGNAVVEPGDIVTIDDNGCVIPLGEPIDNELLDSVLKEAWEKRHIKNDKNPHGYPVGIVEIGGAPGELAQIGNNSFGELAIIDNNSLIIKT